MFFEHSYQQIRCRYRQWPVTANSLRSKSVIKLRDCIHFPYIQVSVLFTCQRRFVWNYCSVREKRTCIILGCFCKWFLTTWFCKKIIGNMFLLIFKWLFDHLYILQSINRIKKKYFTYSKVDVIISFISIYINK